MYNEKSKMIKIMYSYLCDRLITGGGNIIDRMKSRYWERRLPKMREGEIIDLYYKYADKRTGANR